MRCTPSSIDCVPFDFVARAMEVEGKGHARNGRKPARARDNLTSSSVRRRHVRSAHSFYRPFDIKSGQTPDYLIFLPAMKFGRKISVKILVHPASPFSSTFTERPLQRMASLLYRLQSSQARTQGCHFCFIYFSIWLTSFFQGSHHLT